MSCRPFFRPGMMRQPSAFGCHADVIVTVPSTASAPASGRVSRDCSRTYGPRRASRPSGVAPPPAAVPLRPAHTPPPKGRKHHASPRRGAPASRPGYARNAPSAILRRGRPAPGQEPSPTSHATGRAAGRPNVGTPRKLRDPSSVRRGDRGHRVPERQRLGLRCRQAAKPPKLWPTRIRRRRFTR